MFFSQIDPLLTSNHFNLLLPTDLTHIWTVL